MFIVHEPGERAATSPHRPQKYPANIMQPMEPIQPLHLSIACARFRSKSTRGSSCRGFFAWHLGRSVKASFVAPFQLLHQLQEPHTFHFGFVGFPFNPHLKNIYSNCYLHLFFLVNFLFIKMTQKNICISTSRHIKNTQRRTRHLFAFSSRRCRTKSGLVPLYWR